MSANRTSKHGHTGIQKNQDRAADRQQCGVSAKGVRTHNLKNKNYRPSCISHQNSSSTWTEPPSLSAVRCDPRVSLLVTGVGWDSLPLGSGDLTQRAKRVEAGGHKVTEGVGEEMWWVGCVWKNKEEGSDWKKKRKKNYRSHIPSRSGLVKTYYVNRGVEGSKSLCKADQNTIKGHARVKKTALISLRSTEYIKDTII